MTQLRWALALLAVLMMGAASVVLVNGYHERRASKAEQQAIALRQQVETLGRQANEHKAAADTYAVQVGQQDATIAKLKAKLRASQGPSARPSVPPASVADGGLGVEQPGNVSVGDGSTGIRDQIIEAQDQQITALKGETLELRAALDAKGKALATSEQRARGLEIANDALKHAAASSKWLGRIQGFAIGVGAGYVAGRIH